MKRGLGISWSPRTRRAASAFSICFRPVLKEEVDSKKKTDSKSVQNKKSSGSGNMTLRILTDLPPIVGADQMTYGGFKKEDVVALPERNAKIFIKHGYGEEIDFDF